MATLRPTALPFLAVAVLLLAPLPMLPAAAPDLVLARVGPDGALPRPAALGLLPGEELQADTLHGRLLAMVRQEGLPGGLPLWASRYDGTGANWDIVHGLDVDPLGRRVYVTGESVPAGSWQKYYTIGYDAATGLSLWERSFGGDTVYSDVATDVAAGPEGERVYVTGFAQWSGTGGDYATVAYDGLTGDQLWVARYNGGSFDQATSVAVSPDGAKVFVTGYSMRIDEGAWSFAAATAAYDSATGAQLWSARYVGDADDYGLDLLTSPDGTTLYVTGISYATGQRYDLLTVAYDTATGAQRWAARYDGPASGDDKGRGLALSPDGATLYVGGESGASNGLPDFVTVAYDAATGAERWAGRYDGTAAHYDVAEGVGVSPDGARVYMGGWSVGDGTDVDYAAVGLDAATGAQAWAARFDGSGSDSDYAWDLAVGPGDRVYVTGQSWSSGTAYDMTTVAWDGASGARLWVNRYDGPASERDYGNRVVLDPLGLRVFVAGYSRGDDVTGTESLDYATAAHLADPGAVAGAAVARLPAP